MCLPTGIDRGSQEGIHTHLPVWISATRLGRSRPRLRPPHSKASLDARRAHQAPGGRPHGSGQMSSSRLLPLAVALMVATAGLGDSAVSRALSL